MFQGRNNVPNDTVKGLGVGPSAVIRLIRTLFPESQVYYYRYFTVIPLIEFYCYHEVYCKGTIMKSRVPEAVYLTSEKVMAKIGSSGQIVRQDDKVIVVQRYEICTFGI